MALGETLRQARVARNETHSEVAAATRIKVQLVRALEQEDYSDISAPIYVKGFIKLYAEHVDLDPYPLIREYVQSRKGPNAAGTLAVSNEDKRRRSTARDQARSNAAEEAEAAPADLFEHASLVKEKSRTRQKSDSRQEPAQADNGAGAARPRQNAILDSDLERWEVNRSQNAVPGGKRERVRAAWAWTRFVAGEIRLRVVQACADLWRAYAGAENRSRGQPGRFRAKMALALAGGLLLAVFLVSGISRLRRTPPPEEPAPPRAATLAVEPPEPYFDTPRNP